MFTEIKDEITRRFLELKLWVQSISKDYENESFRTILHGLFFVYIYGVYEGIIHKIIETTITELNNSHISIDGYIYELYSLIFSNEYDSLYHVSNEHKWEKRWNISNRIILNPVVDIAPALFPTDGRNLKFRQLESIAKSFGLKRAILPRNELGGYINEMVDNRNYIAHGDKLPKEVGRNYTIDDLLLRCNYISEICTYIAESYETYITNREFLRTRP